MKRLIWLPLAGFLLIAGAAVAAASPGVAEKAAALFSQATGPAATSSPSPEDTDGSEDTDAKDTSKDTNDDSDGSTDSDERHGRGFGLHGEFGRGELLEDVLTDLVADGTITQAQADAITDALKQAAEDKRAEFQAQAQEMRETWQQIKGFLEDGVITSDELAQLPEDNPISNFEDILEDGQITQEELNSVMVGPHSRRGGGPGHFHIQRTPPSTESTPAPDDSGTDSSTNS